MTATREGLLISKVVDVVRDRHTATKARMIAREVQNTRNLRVSAYLTMSAINSQTIHTRGEGFLSPRDPCRSILLLPLTALVPLVQITTNINYNFVFIIILM